MASVNYKRKAVAATFGIAFVMAFSILSYTGVVLVQGGLCEKWGYSSQQFSIFFSMYCAGSVIMNFFLGKLVMRFGPKLIVTIGALGPIFGFGLLAVTPIVYLVWVIGLIFGMLLAMPGFVTYNIFVSRWFRQGCGTMMSVGTIIMYVVSIAGVPVIASINTAYGVTAACFAMGIGLSGINLLCSLLLVCNFPEAYQTGPLDIGKKQAAAQTTPEKTAGTKAPLPARAYLRLPVTLLCLSVPAIVSLGSTMITNYSVMIFESFGLEYMQASLCMSIIPIGGAVWSPVFGILSDKIGSRKAVTIFGVIGGIVCIAVPLAFRGWVAGILFASFVNISCYMNMYSGLVIPSLYGGENSMELIGWAGTIQGIVGVFAAPLAMAIYNAAQSFAPVLILCGVLFFGSVVANLLVMTPKTAEKIKALQKAD